MSARTARRRSPSITRRRCWPGEWRPTARRSIRYSIGFHLSSLYSPRRLAVWERIAREWEACQSLGRGQADLHQHRAGRDLGRDRRGARLAASLRTARGLARRHGAAGRALPHRRRRRAEGPHRGLDLGLGPRPGELADRSPRHRWRARRGGDLGAAVGLLGETWPHASGVRLGLARLGIDTGYEAPAVYAWVRRQAGARCCRSRAPRASTVRRRCRGRRTSMPPKAASRSAVARGCGRLPSPPSRARPTATCGRQRRRDDAIVRIPPATSTCPGRSTPSGSSSWSPSSWSR